jgi:hypothetical protein
MWKEVRGYWSYHALFSAIKEPGDRQTATRGDRQDPSAMELRLGRSAIAYGQTLRGAFFCQKA